MGRTLLTAIHTDPDCTLTGGFEHAASLDLGKKLSSISRLNDDSFVVEPTIDALLPHTDIVIDFTTPFATVDLVAKLASAGKAAIIGTTGLKEDQEKEIATAAKHIPIMRSGNMSLGVNLLIALVRKAAASLGEDFDIEIQEAHHRHKIDSPSGTALMLGRAAAEARATDFEEKAVFVREGIMPERQAGQIGFSVTRAGGIIGDHKIVFGSDEEVLTLSHRAMDRALFARGAVTAAKWLHGRAPGLYDMSDVLGL